MSRTSWVLISEGGGGESRAALAAVRSLAAAGYQTAVTVSGPLSLAAASRHTSRRVPAPSVHDDPEGYAAAVRAELARREYLDVLCASDAALIALDRPVGTLLDKEVTGRLAREGGLDVPTTRVFATRAELLEAGDELDYPVVVKPAVKWFMAARVDAAHELAEAVPAGHDTRLLVQPWLTDDLRGVVGLCWEGRIILAAHLRYERVWPYPCGTVSAAETVAADRDLERSLERLLGDYQGLFHVDLAGTNLLDVNPRLHAATPLALAGGINLPAAYCDLLQGRTVREERARPGLRYRWEEGDLRSLIRQRRQGDLSLSELWEGARPRRKTVHSVVSIADPGPTLERGRYLMRRLRRSDPISW
jgi:predicted ATP-grasp superfamily ATP-dependent carboligase